jgi:hypothetical protein
MGHDRTEQGCPVLSCYLSNPLPSYRHSSLPLLTNNQLSYPLTFCANTRDTQRLLDKAEYEARYAPKVSHFLSRFIALSCYFCIPFHSVISSLSPTHFLLCLTARLFSAVDSETDSLTLRRKRRQKLSAASLWKRSPAPSRK